MARSSSEDSEYRRSRKSKNKRKHRRSRSASRDLSRRRRGRSDRRSRSVDSSRSRSRSRDRQRYRKRSRSYESPKRSRRRSRSRSRSPKRYARSRSRSPRNKSSKKQKRRSRTPKKSSTNQIEAFGNANAAEVSKAKLKAAVLSKDISKSSSAPLLPVPSTREDFMSNAANHVEHAERALILENLDEDEFMPTHFKSSRKKKLKDSHKPKTAWNTAVQTFAEQESHHEMAMFGTLEVSKPDGTKTKPEIQTDNFALSKKLIKWEDRDPKSLIHDSFDLTQKQCDQRWKNHLDKCLQLTA